MQGELITFETAKLAKEKGLKIYNNIYTKDGNKSTIGKYYNKIVKGKQKELADRFCYPCSTQSLLQKWLREVHKILVIVKPMVTEYEFELADEWEVVVYLGHKGNYIKITEFKTYEEALEEGLQKALKMV